MDHPQLIVQAGRQAAVVLRIAPRKALPAEMIQVAPGVKALRHIVLGELYHPELDLHIAPLGDFVGVVQGLRGVWKEGAHLLLGLAVILSALVAHPVLIRHLLACLDAEQDIVSLGVLRVGVVDIVGGHKRNPCVLAQAQQALVHHPLLRHAVVLELQEEISLSENPTVLFRRALGLLVHATGQVPLHLPGQAGAQGDDSLVIRLQHLIVHPGLVVEAVHKAPAHQLHEVFIALIVLRQKHQVIIPVLPAHLLPVKPGARRHIDLAA